MCFIHIYTDSSNVTEFFFGKIVSKLFCFTDSVNKKIRDYIGFSVEDYISLIKKLICNVTDTGVNSLDKTLFKNELEIIDKLSHKVDICKYYLTPTDFDKMQNNFIMKPFVKVQDNYFFIDCCYSLWNFYNVLFELFENEKSIINSISEAIGKNIELIIREECCDKKFPIHYGKYKKSEYECDLVIETKKSVIFVECKKKEFTMAALSGDMNKLLDDYIKAVIEAQAQCLEHARFLHENQKMEFVDSNSTLELNDRKIIRISVGLFDTYALNEHYNTMRGLEFASHKQYSYSFSKDAPKKFIKSKTAQFEKSNRKLSSINENLGVLKKFETDNGSEKEEIKREMAEKLNSWNLSLEHILFLLNKCKEDSLEIDDELQYMNNMTFCSSDFYLKYENARKMKEQF